MGQFENAQDQLAKANTALGNAETEMTEVKQENAALKQEVVDLKEKISGMGLTAAQEEVIFTGIDSIVTRVQALTTVDENATTEQQPVENGDGSEI